MICVDGSDVTILTSVFKVSLKCSVSKISPNSLQRMTEINMKVMMTLAGLMHVFLKIDTPLNDPNLALMRLITKVWNKNPALRMLPTW